jgi:hypothetical protein
MDAIVISAQPAPATLPRVNNLIHFPQRRICALGVPESALSAVRASMPYVAISTDGKALQRCDLLILDRNDGGAGDLVRWIRQRVPQFPVLLWDAAATTFVEQIRRLLFA